MRKPKLEVSPVGCQLGISLECRLKAICGYQSKWSPVVIIIGVLLCVIESSYVLFALFVNTHCHAIHITILIIMIQVYIGSMKFLEVVIKFIINLINVW